MRSIAVGVVLVAGVLASIASTPGPGADITGSSGTFELTLDAPGDSHDATATATLEANAPLAPGSGEVGVTVEIGAASTGQLSLALRSDMTGEANSAVVLCPESQPSVRIAVPAFGGCSGAQTCAEELTIRFARIDDDGDGPFTLRWNLDGLASVKSEDPNTAGAGTLEFSVQE